ncbi:Tetraspanin family integral membrane protein [Handroanthus impetiginosus]|uniref:Tetraspanin family integral membrane protein n=1 Tax=Handroanthus impetiginosus TaxID=429701 RepID=A0A2G9GZQ3_9LAMI|nr:Tetraspanin family integral membrane protein [Handroanthus impetiginosus]
MRTSNHLIGFLNFLTFLLSIPILGGGIWLSSRANTTDCMKFLQWPLIIIGASVMVVSLAGFAGACYRNTFLMYLYLWAMFFIIAALVGFVIFAYSVTEKGSGRAVMNRDYMEYSLQDYSGWLAERVASQRYWNKIASCIRQSGVCRKIGRNGAGMTESAQQFYLRKLTPIESGCCKPPTSCGYTYINETFWMSEGGLTGNDPDCMRWNNDQEQLCYSCDSCKAGVLASLKTSWSKVSVINIIILIILVLLYVAACAAFRHNRQLDTDEAYGETRMEKARPSWLF